MFYSLLSFFRDMSKMINAIMEEMWDRSFMSSHSLTGKNAPTDKRNNTAKPALPKEDVEVITSKLLRKKQRSSSQPIC